MDQIVVKLQRELEKLGGSAYREEQDVWMDSKQLRHLRKLLAKAVTKRKEEVSDFARCVNDVAGPTSKLSELTVVFYRSLSH